MNDDEFGWWRALGYAGFAALGGVLGHLMRTLDKKHQIHFGRAILEGVSAGFVGLLVLLLCDATGVSKQWTGVIVGVCGWMGPSATIRLLELIVKKRLNLTNTPEERK